MHTFCIVVARDAIGARARGALRACKRACDRAHAYTWRAHAQLIFAARQSCARHGLFGEFGTLMRFRSWAYAFSVSRALPQARLRTRILRCAANALRIVGIVRAAALPRQAPTCSMRAPRTVCAHSMHTISALCTFVHRCALDARIGRIGCAGAHVFAHAVQSAPERGICAHSLYARSSNCVHHRPSVKSGTKTGSRFGDAVWARVARHCTRQRAFEVCAARVERQKD